MKVFIAMNAEDGSIWLVNATSEDVARNRLGNAVKSDGDEFAIAECRVPGSLPVDITKKLK